MDVNILILLVPEHSLVTVLPRIENQAPHSHFLKVYLFYYAHR